MKKLLSAALVIFVMPVSLIPMGSWFEIQYVAKPALLKSCKTDPLYKRSGCL